MIIDLDALQTHLRNLGNPLVLQGSDDALGPLAGVVAAMPGRTITLDTNATPVRIEGDTLTVEGTTTSAWPIDGLGDAKLTVCSATLTVTSNGATTVSVAAALPVAPEVAPAVDVTPVTGQPGAWQVALDGPADGVSPTDLLALGLGTGPLPFTIPPSLDVFGQIATVEPASFILTFLPGGSPPTSYYAFTVDVTTGSWHLINDVVEFDGLEVGAVIATGAWSVTVTGHLTIAGIKMALAIQVGSSPVWTATLLPDGAQAFPGIVDLANWFSSGNTTLGQQTQTGFSGLQLDPKTFDLALSGVRLSFDTGTAKVVSLEIDSVLTVVGLELDLILLLPAVTLAGSLAKPGTLVTDMLKSCGISAVGVPETLSITTASFTADASTSTYTAGVGVDGVWPSGPLELKEITATIGYLAGSWSGTFDARLGIAGTTVDLSASYEDPGWTFAGRTVPPTQASIGKLLQDLSDDFGIGTVPQALRSLTLTDLEVSYATTGAFCFACTCTLDVNSTQVTLIATINVTKTSSGDADDKTVSVGTRGYSARFGGTITFDDLEFDLVFDLTDDNADIFVADYVAAKDAGSTQLKALVAELSTTLAASIPDGIELDLDEVKFCFYKQTSTLWVFGLRLGASIDLSDLPVVGSRLPADLKLSLEDLQALYASDDLSPGQVSAINAVLPSKVAPLPATLTKGIGLQGKLSLGNSSVQIGTGIQPAQPATQPSTQPSTQPAHPPVAVAGDVAAAPTKPSDPIHWIDLNKQFGIFSFRRIGIGYADNHALFSLDASVALGPVGFELLGLTVGSPLDKFAPQFSLDGLFLAFDRPPIQLGGGFVRVPQIQNGHKFDAYYGQVLVRLPQFGLTAIGGWAPDADPAMFFIYLAIDAPIGGPPFLQVTGLSGGFGINSRLVLPTIDNLTGYPLLPSPSTPPQPADPSKGLGDVLAVLQSTFEIQAGQYWVAAGISASSFEMITVTAVVAVSFGVEVQIGVLGSGTMTLPSGEADPVAYIEIDVVASYTPSTGVLSIVGKLSPASFIYGGFVKLSGGFALAAWFKDTTDGAKAGDFVVSVGGYHPAFSKPANYPTVPRLTLSYSLGPVKVVGQAYVALTPGAFMAGMTMQATFSAGSVSAWFTAGIDFLIAWAPFHYVTDAWAQIGCKVDLGLFSIRVQVGASLQVWGPQFGGRASVDLDVTSFTIKFGATASQPPPVGWTTLADKFLPQPPTKAQAAKAYQLGPALAAATDPAPPTGLVSAAVPHGILSNSSPGVDWIIDPNDFRISVRSTLPANHPVWTTAEDTTVELPDLVADYNSQPVSGLPDDLLLALDPSTVTYSATLVWQPELNIAPMRQTTVQSYFTVTLVKRDEDGDAWSTYINGLTVLPQLGNANAALWGSGQAASDPNGQRLVPSALVGLDLAPIPRHPDAVNDVNLLELIFEEGIQTGFIYQPAAAPSAYTVGAKLNTDRSRMTITVHGAHEAELPNSGYVLSALVNPWVSAQRSATADALHDLGFATPSGSEISLTVLASQPLSGWPAVALIGQPS